MSAAGVMDGMPPGFISPSVFWFVAPAAPGAQAIPVPAPPPSLTFPPGFRSPGAWQFVVGRSQPDSPANSAGFLDFFP